MTKKISTSSLRTYELCSLMYKFKYIDRKKPEVPKNHAAVFGSAIHKLLEKMYETENFTKNFLIKNWKQVFAETCEKENVNIKTNYWIREGFKILNNFYYVAKKKDLLKPAVCIEKYFKLPLKDFFLTGKIDIIIRMSNGGLLILDFKTGKNEISNRDLANDVQMTFYSWAGRRILNEKEAQVALFYLRTGHIKPSTRNRGHFISLAKRLIKTLKQIEKKEFCPSFKGCKYCEYPQSCREWINSKKVKIDLL